MYLTSSADNARKFAYNPMKYVVQSGPPPALPPTCAIIGPELSGVSSAAAALARSAGVQLITPEAAVEWLVHDATSDTGLKEQVSGVRRCHS